MLQTIEKSLNFFKNKKNFLFYLVIALEILMVKDLKNS